MEFKFGVFFDNKLSHYMFMYSFNKCATVCQALKSLLWTEEISIIEHLNLPQYFWKIGKKLKRGENLDSDDCSEDNKVKEKKHHGVGAHTRGQGMILWGGDLWAKMWRRIQRGKEHEMRFQEQRP